MSKSPRPRPPRPRDAARRPEAAADDGDRPWTRPAGRGDRGRDRPREGGREGGRDGPRDGSVWLFGVHAVRAALTNPARTVLEVRATRNASADLPSPLPPGIEARIVDPEAIEDALGPGAVHQGLAARVMPLPDPGLPAALEASKGLAIVLDQVTDPQNVGAVFRSAAAFGAGAIVSQDRRSAPQSGALAKAAVGAIETVADVRVVNVSQAIRDAQATGWRAIGLSGEVEASLDSVLDGSPTLIVLGAEGKGLRPLVADTCDVLARIPIGPAMESLNVSVAAGVALASAARARDLTAARETALALLAALEADDHAAARARVAPGFKAHLPGGPPVDDPALFADWRAGRVAALRLRVDSALAAPAAGGIEVGVRGALRGEWPDGERFKDVALFASLIVEGGLVTVLRLSTDLAEAL